MNRLRFTLYFVFIHPSDQSFLGHAGHKFAVPGVDGATVKTPAHGCTGTVDHMEEPVVHPKIPDLLSAIYQVYERRGITYRKQSFTLQR